VVSRIVKWRDLADFLWEGKVCHLPETPIKATSQINFLGNAAKEP